MLEILIKVERKENLIMEIILAASMILPFLNGVMISMFAVKLWFKQLNLIGVLGMLTLELFMLGFLSFGIISIGITSLITTIQLILAGFITGCIVFSIMQRKMLSRRQNK